MQRVVDSAAFAKSERLSSFLTCICELTLAGRSSEINEQKIGTAVFGRPRDYDSTIDGIVRPQASRLRQRLDIYFNGEGSEEPLRITLPRGSYVPIFEPHANPNLAPAVSNPSPESSPAPVPTEFPAISPKTRSTPWVWITVTIVLVALLALGILRTIPTTITSTTSHPLWSLLFRPDQQTMVVPSDTGLVMWRGITKQNIDLAEYLLGNYRSKTAEGNAKEQVDVADLANRRYTSIVDLDVVKSLQHVADSERSKFDLRYARDVRPNDLKSGNVVLIGAAAANPWVELFEPKMNFVFSDAHIRKYTVLNRAAVGTEPSKWSSDYDDPQKRVYGVVAFMSNLSGTGNVLILEGTSMAGTECAWDFVSDDSSLLPFLHRIKRADGTIPHFQLVLESINLNDSSVKRTILAWRTMD
ncbi:hypothetical protein [Tunturibacter empetritectus]|uniref:Uncharacterized protein n=1 Tax=Tunturiibacter empetritectus TaxID=3069691 RepID=A0A7W8ILF0_9BACT|nr:hypothetical protein [Edaphobacter lichenicola]MBB5319400.1 hypothetical protein [Edaphobacter lichenicola]